MQLQYQFVISVCVGNCRPAWVKVRFDRSPDICRLRARSSALVNFDPNSMAKTAALS